MSPVDNKLSSRTQGCFHTTIVSGHVLTIDYKGLLNTIYFHRVPPFVQAIQQQEAINEDSTPTSFQKVP